MCVDLSFSPECGLRAGIAEMNRVWSPLSGAHWPADETDSAGSCGAGDMSLMGWGGYSWGSEPTEEALRGSDT